MADKRTRWIIEATSNIPDINTQLERLIQLQRTQNDLTQQNTTSTALAIQRQREQIEGLAAAQTKANTSSSAGAKQQTDAIGTLRKEYDLLSKQLSGLVQLAAGAWAVGQLKTYVDEVIRAKSSQDGFVASMEQMLGSRLKAEELNAKLIQIALKSPFETEQLQEVTKKLQGMGVETEKIIPYINMLGDIAAIVGTQKLPLIAKALTDVQSKHVLMAQEIKQFTDNGVPLYDLLAKSMGKPVEQIRLLASEHKLVFEDVEKALMQATQKGGIYYGQMAAQSKQLGGQIANLGDMYTLAQAKIGDYFEKGIKAGIKASNDLIEATIGSDNAITRLITTGKAALAMWISYRTAVLSIEAAQRANSVSSLAALGALEAQQVATVGLTFGTTSLSAAFNGLRVAFMSNPFGFVATAVTSLISLFYTFKAATIEVGDAQNLEAENLRKVNREMEVSIEAAIRATEGTKDRKDKIDDLIKKYPEYFAGMTAEQIQNTDLQRILKDVNGTFEERIKLATLAYQQNKLIEKDAELAEKQAEAVKKLRLEYEKLSASNPSDEGFIKAIQNQQSFWDKAANIIPGMLTGGLIESNLSEAQFILSERKKLSNQLVSMESDAAKVRVGIEHDANLQKLKSLSDQLSKGEISIKEYNAAILSGTNDVVAKQVKAVSDGEDKKKSAKKASAELSIENDLKELKSLEQTSQVKMAILVTEEKLKIEQAKRQITNSADEQERILSIEKEYANKRNTLVIETAQKNMAEAVKWFEKEVEAGKAKQAKFSVMRDAEVKEVKAMYNEIAKLDNELLDVQARNKEKQAEYDAVYNADALARNRKFWQDSEVVYLEGIRAQRQAQIDQWTTERAGLEARALMLKDSVTKQEEYKKILIQIAILNGDISAAEAKNYEDSKKIHAKKLAQFQEISQAILNGITSLQSADWASFDASMERASEYINDFYDLAAEGNKNSFDKQVEMAGSSMEKIGLIYEEFAQKQRDILGDKRAFEAYESQMKMMVESTKQTEKDVNSFLSTLSEGKWVQALVQGIVSITQGLKKAKEDKHELEMQALENAAKAIEDEKVLIQSRLDAQLNALAIRKEEEEKVFDALRAEQEKYYAEQEARERQFYSDSQLRLLEDSNYRAQLLKDGEAREVQSLEEAKARQIQAANERYARMILEAQQKGATEAEVAAISIKQQEEVTDITNSFNKLIADKHKEYQDAIGNQSKETSLANEQVKAEEATAIDKIANELQSHLDDINAAAYKAELMLANAILSAKKQAADAEMSIDRQVWEAKKQMALAELEFEWKKLNSKANKDIKAMIEIKHMMDQIQNMPNPFGEVSQREIANRQNDIPRAAQPAKTYTSSRGTTSDRGTTEESPGRGEVVGPRGRFHGDTWVGLGDNPDGIDTIPLNLHKGERIMPSYLNQFLGKNVTNQDLVHGYLQYANLGDRLPDISIPNIPSLQIPDMVSSSSAQMSMDRVEKELQNLNKTFANKSLINVNIDANNVSISEKWHNHKVNYYDTLLNK